MKQFTLIKTEQCEICIHKSHWQDDAGKSITNNKILFVG